MNDIVLYNVNIAVEGTIILVLIIMLITLLRQKTLFITVNPLICLSCFTIFMIANQIVAWAFLLFDVPLKYGALPMQVVYILDYIFSYGVGYAFYWYADMLVVSGYQNAGIAYEHKNHIKKLLITFGVVSSIIYALLLFIPALYRMEAGKEIFSVPAYILVHIAVKFAYICALVYIIRHRKVLGKHATAIGIILFILISVFVVVDELYGLCVGHVFAVFCVFFLYVTVDLHKGLLLERQEKEIALWKTQIMLSQMQPHFLYNVLTTISGLCEMQNATEARDVVNHFADYFRTNLESLEKEKTISFEKELEHIKTYLWLEKVRFEDYLNICYEIETTDFAVPSLTVQPIVENAVKHGILPKDDKGTVTIKTYEASADYVIEIKDDGVGFGVNEKLDDNRSHIGIENVTKRLNIICRGRCEIESEKGKGTVVKICIPKGERL